MARARETERRLQEHESKSAAPMIVDDRTDILERELRLSQERLHSEETTVARLRSERDYAREELQGCQNDIGDYRLQLDDLNNHVEGPPRKSCNRLGARPGLLKGHPVDPHHRCCLLELPLRRRSTPQDPKPSL